MDRCPICDTKIQHAAVICRACGEELPLTVVIVSEGSRGGHVAVVAEHTAGPHPGPDTPEEDVYER
jgi:hypothetical protein